MKTIRPVGLIVAMILFILPAVGCESGSITEINGKTSFGPEFRNFGNNTQDIRYTAIQGLEFKLANKWTVGMSYQRRDVDEGSGDNENALLFEIGYPLWNAPKPEKTAEDFQIEELERELRELDYELAAATPAVAGPPVQLAQANNNQSQNH